MTFKFAVYGPSTHGTTVVISRHMTEAAAKRALKLAKGNPLFYVVAL